MDDNNLEEDFPIFTIHGQDYLEEEANNVVELNKEIQEVSDIIRQTSLDLENSGNRLNLYVNNTVKCNEKFNYEEHIIVFDEDENVCIYPGELIDDFIRNNKSENDMSLNDEEMENLLKSLPPSNKKFNPNKKQKHHILNLMQDFNSIFGQYELYVYQFNELTDEYNEIIQNIKNHLDVMFIDVTKVIDKNYEIEKFNEDKHELLITKDTKNSKWEFVYIRKDDKEKFLKKIGKG